MPWSHDPDKLLADYAALQVKIGETRAKLKAFWPPPSDGDP